MINTLESLVSQILGSKKTETQRGTWSCPRSHSSATGAKDWSLGGLGGGKIKSRMLSRGEGGQGGCVEIPYGCGEL